MEHICVVGLGYVGTPVAALFARSGLMVTGIDVDQGKVDAINNGVYPFEGEEPGMAEIVQQVVGSGHLKATTDPTAIQPADAVLVCVQTPFDVETMEPNYSALKAALANIGRNLKPGALVVVESTLAPTTMDHLVRPTLEEASGLEAGKDFLLGHCPERVMPGRLVHNLTNYGRALGAVNAQTHRRMRELYGRIVKDELVEVDLVTAEVIKTFENTYRDVQIALANEFAKYCDLLGVDLFTVRKDINRFPNRQMLLPGTGVGGHCIPKDTYLLAYGTKHAFRPELMLMARKINDSMPQYTAEKALALLREAGVEPKEARVGVLGYSYLGDSDDTRSTPSEQVVKSLEPHVKEIRIHDPYVKKAPGRTIEADLEAVVQGADLLVVSTAHSLYQNADLRKLGKAMRTRAIVDGRHVFGRAVAEQAGFFYAGIGG